MDSFLIVGIVCAFSGCFFAWRALRVQRRGDVLHCAQCDYNLTGLASDRCPECGTSVSEQLPVVGERYRRWWSLLPAVVCLTIASVLLTGAAQHINWYQYKPSSWVVDDWQSINNSVRSKARTELDRRRANGSLRDRMIAEIIDVCIDDIRDNPGVRAYEAFDVLSSTFGLDQLSSTQEKRLIDVLLGCIAKRSVDVNNGCWKWLNAVGLGRLSDDQTQQLITIALDRQGADDAVDPAYSIQPLLNYLKTCYLDDQLTKPQADRMFKQMLRLELDIRSTLVRGDPFPCSLSQSKRGPAWRDDDVFWAKFDDEQVRVDGEPLRSGLGIHETAIHTSSGTSTTMLKYDQPGKHQLAYAAHMTIYCCKHDEYYDYAHRSNLRAKSKRCYAQKILLEAPFEVLAEEPADYIRMIDAPELAEEIRAAITIERIAPNTEWMIQLDINPLPQNVAFDIDFVIDAKAHRIGGLALVKNKKMGYHMLVNEDLSSVETVDVIFRASDTEARKSIDIYEIWDGELTIKDVPVTPRDKPSQP